MSKELRSKRMRGLLARGRRKARGHPPSEGMMRSLINETLPNGWHYQCDWVYDLRIQPRPYIIAWAFPPSTRGCESARYHLLHVQR